MSDSKRWHWLAAEFTIIVLGVLAALFVDTWIDERQDMERAEIYRERLVMDLETDVLTMGDQIGYMTAVRQEGLRVLADLEGRERLEDLDLIFAAFLAAEELGFQTETATFNDMQSTGGLRLIDDLEIRADLAGYHRLAVSRNLWWQPYNDFRVLARGIIPNRIQEQIHTLCDGVSVAENLEEKAAASRMVILPALASDEDHCGIDVSGIDVAGAASELRRAEGLDRMLRYRVSQIRVSLRLFASQRELAQDLIRRLEQGRG